MESPTLKLITKHWSSDLPTADDLGTIDLPFNIEEFCRENDAILTKVEQSLTSAVSALHVGAPAHKQAMEALEEVRKVLGIGPRWLK